KTLFDGKKYAEALKAYDAALAQKPGDAAATAGKRAAQAELDKPDPKVEEAKRKEVAYQAAMKQAETLFETKKYAEAVKAYDAALLQKPGDVAAQNGRKAAIDAQTPKVDPNKDKQREEDFKLALSAAQAAMKQGKYQGAINAYNQALALKK